MKSMRIIFFSLLLLTFLNSCSNNDLKKDTGISLDQIEEDETGNETPPKKELLTRPTNVLLTGNSDHRLVTVYKVNYNSRTKKNYTGTNRFHRTYSYNYNDSYETEDRSTYRHFMPGIEAVHGYNMMNVAHYNFETQEGNDLFEKPVLINTLYYPSLRQDSLNNKPISRDYYLISVYDEDTNQDSLINRSDLRRLYHFDLEGKTKSPLVPLNYSVLSSEYDTENDAMFVFAKLDENENGRREEKEPIHIFWLDMKTPKMGLQLY